jgi:hypothetical protein
MDALRAIPDDSWSRTATWSDGQIHSVADIVELRLVRHVADHAQQAQEAARS